MQLRNEDINENGEREFIYINLSPLDVNPARSVWNYENEEGIFGEEKNTSTLENEKEGLVMDSLDKKLSLEGNNTFCSAQNVSSLEQIPGKIKECSMENTAGGIIVIGSDCQNLESLDDLEYNGEDNSELLRGPEGVVTHNDRVEAERDLRSQGDINLNKKKWYKQKKIWIPGLIFLILCIGGIATAVSFVAKKKERKPNINCDIFDQYDICTKCKEGYDLDELTKKCNIEEKNGRTIEISEEVKDQFKQMIMDDDFEQVKSLYEQYPSIRLINETKSLVLTCRFGNLEIFRFLLSKGANPHILGDSGKSCLIWASEKTWRPDHIILKDAKRKETCYNGIATYYGHHEKIIEDLVNKKVDLNAKFKESEGEYVRYVSPIKLLLNAKKSVYEYKDLLPNVKSRFRSIKLLVENGASINIPESYNQNILHELCGNEYWISFPEIFNFVFEKLKERGLLETYINKQNQWDETPFQMLVKHTDTRIVPFDILKLFTNSPYFGDDRNTKETQKKSMIANMIKRGTEVKEMEELILEFSLDVNHDSATKKEHSPLICAIKQKRIDILDFLLEKGAKVEDIAYTWALYVGDSKMVQKLEQLIPEVKKKGIANLIILKKDNTFSNQVGSGLWNNWERGVSPERLLLRTVLVGFLYPERDYNVVYDLEFLEFFMKKLKDDHSYDINKQDDDGNSDLHFLLGQHQVTDLNRFFNVTNLLLKIFPQINKNSENCEKQTPIKVFHKGIYVRFMRNIHFKWEHKLTKFYKSMDYDYKKEGQYRDHHPEIKRNCPGGHGFKKTETPYDGCYNCDCCGKHIPRENFKYGCKLCNFDVCMPCHGSEEN